MNSSVVATGTQLRFVVVMKCRELLQLPIFVVIALCPSMWWILEKVDGRLRRMCSVVLGGTFCRCLLGSFDLTSAPEPPYLGFVDDLGVGESQVLKYPLITVLALIVCACLKKSTTVSFMKFGALVGAYMFIIVISWSFFL